MPRRVVGREEVRRLLVAAGQRSKESGRRITGYSGVSVHQTSDPEVIEFELNGEIAATGMTYQYSFIQVIRVRDGQIISFCDYIDPRVFAEANPAR